MPSRRDVLAGAGVAAATGLAGCLGDDSLPAVVPRDGPVDPRRTATATATPVGHDVTRLGHGDRGRVVARSVLYERDDGTLLVFSEPRLISARIDADWKTAGATVAHDWTPSDGDGDLSSHDSRFVRADETRETPYRLGVETGPTTCRWTFRVRPPTSSTVVPAFRSAFRPATPPTPGDSVVEVLTDARVANWRVRRDRFVGRVELTYRPDAVE
jgi:hypothetical protein